MKKIFDTVLNTRPRMSSFDLSHEKKLSTKMGQLTPILIEEVVPGDQFKGRTETMIRMAPMIAPVMHRVNTFVHYFFVPNRILWNQWEDFMSGGREGTTKPVMPTVTLSGAVRAEGTLADYLGLPSVTGNVSVNKLPFQAYQQIYNDYYRDPNLTDPIDIDGTASVISSLRQRAWEKDYFTSALPWPQRGPDVSLNADITENKPSILRKASDDTPIAFSTGLNTRALGEVEDAATNELAYIDGAEDVQFTINELRNSSALQRWLEKNARGGYRYIEQILAHFGVKSSDKRLQRAEYLGGGQSPMVISEVLNTSATASEPQGGMAGHGIGTSSGNSFKPYSVEEHGYIIGIMSVLPRTAYQQGVPRHWNRSDSTDYYWPAFANLGEQEVLNKELYMDPSDTDYSEGTFGYQQRYAEYKYACDTVHGDFKDSLDFWHMGRILSSQPALNASFVESDPTDRIFAVNDGKDTLWCQVYNSIQARRPMPYHAMPSLK
ncbi:major capsid protein [Microviridae sp.]|nr:major capsid protein [Microviridae sp.]